MRPRNIPYAMRDKVEKELDRLEKEGVLTKTSTSEWATPIVPIVKKNNQIRICGDYKVTVNKALKVDKYPLPKPRDIFATLAGGEKFTKLDLRQAYLQCPVNKHSREILTLNTHKGLYTTNRLAFGISPSPSIWQRKMEQILSDIPFCHCILDDILLTGRDDDEHLHILEQVLTRLSQHNLRLNIDKCYFLQDKLEYCGHMLTKDGVYEAPDKIAAIVEAPCPTNTAQLRSFLGMVTFYHNHLPNVSKVLYPLNQLLNKSTKWKWTAACENAFTTVKQLIASDTCLTYFDPTSPLVLSTDASPYGIGAVLAHRTADGDERPICFA